MNDRRENLGDDPFGLVALLDAFVESHPDEDRRAMGRHIAAQIRTVADPLHIKDGDVIVVTYRREVDQRTIAVILERFAERLRSAHYEVLVVGCVDGMTVAQLDKEKMARFGWVRQGEL